MFSKLCVAGTVVVDIVYLINRYPAQGELSVVRDGIERISGGPVSNTGACLAALDPNMPVEAMGLIGTDAEGDFLLNILKKKGLDCSLLLRDPSTMTSFTAVMTDENTRQRTMFSYPGANARFCEDHVDWDHFDADLLHVGFMLLLDALDAPDDEYGTKLARLLSHAQTRGIKTSIDMVSDLGDRFKKVVLPSIKYADYCIINELEAQAATDVILRDEEGRLIRENFPAALKALRDLGVSTWAVIHCPEICAGMDSEGNYHELESLHLPKGYIKGTVGAGDAFCAGILSAAAHDMSLPEALVLGTATAAASLSTPDATAGVGTIEEVLANYRALR